MTSNIVIFLLTALTSYFFTSFLINPLIKFMPDIPNHRSSHSEVTPKGGGIAIIISSSLAFILIGQYEFLFLSVHLGSRQSNIVVCSSSPFASVASASVPHQMPFGYSLPVQVQG